MWQKVSFFCKINTLLLCYVCCLHIIYSDFFIMKKKFILFYISLLSYSCVDKNDSNLLNYRSNNQSCQKKDDFLPISGQKNENINNAFGDFKKNILDFISEADFNKLWDNRDSSEEKDECKLINMMNSKLFSSKYFNENSKKEIQLGLRKYLSFKFYNDPNVISRSYNVSNSGLKLQWSDKSEFDLNNFGEMYEKIKNKLSTAKIVYTDKFEECNKNKWFSENISIFNEKGECKGFINLFSFEKFFILDRITIINNGEGVGTTVAVMLLLFAKLYGYEKVLIQNNAVVSGDIIAIWEKFGFRYYENNSDRMILEMEDIDYTTKDGSYIITINYNKIKQKLVSKKK